MDINKFEYWAKRKGMSCVRSKVKWHNEMYTNEDTERAYNIWVTASSTKVQDLYEDQVKSEMVYKSLTIDNKYFINACFNILDNLYTSEGELEWLFKWTQSHEKDNTFVLRELAQFKNMCKKSLIELAKLTNLRDFTSWRTREDYTKSKKLIQSAIIGVTSPGYSGYGLESALKSKVGKPIMVSRVTFESFEYKFTDEVIELATQLAEKEKYDTTN